ncbi:GntR family transcriptional regulator [Neisseria meningitidis]|uniref:GntR family transcriptional regulator n=1 Tax=Neisseria meningitidis TaxID=487 RepID=UPI001C585B38|nr:GntR family transcriptional regulator [Neisseria meningitidis]MBW3877824.1 GntR family transcriptional regulator [Neisseria meningitidis]MBW3884250.1 GntR family transcriptional regulator [Neisseria meningitidis]MBW3926489.1 GntR family transcriptional regulator [Neisseria meningitidis]MBW3940413.1 GntR family transcriptional regulator [Neisseria meningitidis]
MKEFPDLEKRLIMLEVAVQDLEDRSLADSLVLAWLLQRITRQEPTSIEQVRRFLQAQAKTFEPDSVQREHLESLLAIVESAQEPA